MTRFKSSCLKMLFTVLMFLLTVNVFAQGTAIYLQEQPPSVPTASPVGSGGSCTAGAHTFAYSFVTADGQTGLSNGVNATCVANDSVTVTIALGSGWATGRNIYVSKAGTTAPLYFAQLVADNTSTTATFTLADASLTTLWNTPASLPLKPYVVTINNELQPLFDSSIFLGDVTHRYVLGSGTQVVVGTSTTKLLPAASLSDSSTTTSPATQTTEFVVNSVTIKAGQFNANTRGVTCRAWGTGAANANAKNYKFYFGATSGVTLTGTTDSGKDYNATLTVLRTGASTQTAIGTIASDIGADDAMLVNGAVAETDTADIIVSFKVANTAAAASAATGKGMLCTFIQ